MKVDATATAWANVAAAVNRRMAELGIPDQAELIRRSGLSDATVRGYMTGKPRSTNSRGKTILLMCSALEWTPDSIERLLRGEEPVSRAVVGETKQPPMTMQDRLDWLESAITKSRRDSAANVRSHLDTADDDEITTLRDAVIELARVVRVLAAKANVRMDDELLIDATPGGPSSPRARRPRS